MLSNRDEGLSDHAISKEAEMKMKQLAMSMMIILTLSAGSVANGQYRGGRYQYARPNDLVYMPGVFQISPYGGFLMGDDYEAVIDDSLAYGRIEQDDSPVWGIRMGFGLVPNVGLEFQYAQSQSAFYGVTGDSFFDSESKLSDVDIRIFLVNLNFDFSNEPIVPYFTMGIGTTVYDVQNGSSESEFTGSFGGGIKARIAPNIALRFDVRGYVTEVQDSEYSYYWDGYYYYWEGSSDSYLTTWETTLGLSFII